jgi:hypothetical protein
VSILKSLIESASATIPFADAKPVSIYKQREPLFDNSRIEEELAREKEDEGFLNRIEGLGKRKKKKHKVEESSKISKKVFSEEDDTIVTTKKSSGLFSTICSKSESKDSDNLDIPEDGDFLNQENTIIQENVEEKGNEPG